MPTVHLVIKGKVQGVFYRATAKDVAEKLGLRGWIKNTKEGDVEVVVTGTATQLQPFVDWCRRGPSGAIVTHVQVTEKEEEAFDKFRVIRESQRLK